MLRIYVMKRFKWILCFVGEQTDPSPALEAAAELAEHNQARLKLVDVLPLSTEGPWLTVEGQPDLEGQVLTSRTLDLEELASPIRDRGVHVEAGVTMGSPFVELIRRVVQDEHDLVIKTAQNQEGAPGGLLGTTALHLMRKCPVPVWVVKPPGTERFQRVLAAIDPKPAGESDNQLSLKVLQLASSLAESRGSELQIVHAWWLYSESLLRGRRMNLSSAEVDGMLDEVRGRAELAIEDVLSQIDLGQVHVEIQLEKGQPYEVISRFAAQSDLTVMGTLSRTGISGLLIGNTAERVLRQLNCSVLAVKPEGFETPLKFDD